MNIFLTSDLHEGHQKLIDIEFRPFNSLEEQHTTLVKNWNSVVGHKDIVYILGDVTWKHDFKLLNDYNGNKIIIKGNHDKSRELEKAVTYKYIKEWHDTLTIKQNNIEVYLSHYPHLRWNKSVHGSYHAYGHTHGMMSYTFGKSMDVGIDANNYTPVALEYLVEKLKNRDNSKMYYKNIDY